jgi:hypothetical protein
MRRFRSLATVCALALLASFRPAAAAADPGADARRFTLHCKSAAAGSPAEGFDIDVNLNTGSYYADRRGLEQLGEVDARKIIFRVHFVFEGVPGWREEEYLRGPRELFWNRSPDADSGRGTPDATCGVEPPRPGFGATERYRNAAPPSRHH